MYTYWCIGNQLLIEMLRLGAKVLKDTHLSSFLIDCYTQVFH